MNRLLSALILTSSLVVPQLASAQFSTVAPAQLNLSLDAGTSTIEAVSITVLPLCIRPYEIDVQASDPAAVVANLSGVVQNGCGGDTSNFSVRFTGDGTNRSFDLQFVDAEFGGVLGSIPVTLESEGIPQPATESSGERSTLLSCAFGCRSTKASRHWKSISTLSLVNPGTNAVTAGLVFIDGKQNIIAQSRIELGANDLDELHVCGSLAEGGIAPPLAGLVHVYVPSTRAGADSAVYGWMNDAQGRFNKQRAEPYSGQPFSIAKSECRVVPPSVGSAKTLMEQLGDETPPAIPALLINQTADP